MWRGGGALWTQTDQGWNPGLYTYSTAIGDPKGGCFSHLTYDGGYGCTDDVRFRDNFGKYHAWNKEGA